MSGCWAGHAGTSTLTSAAPRLAGHHVQWNALTDGLGLQADACLQALQLRDLQKVTLLGAGAYGQVLLVKHGGKHYALKCMSKLQIVENGLQVGTAPIPSVWDHASIELKVFLHPAGRRVGQSQCSESASWCSPESQRVQPGGLLQLCKPG